MSAAHVIRPVAVAVILALVVASIATAQSSAGESTADAATPDMVVTRLHEALLAAMKQGETVDYAGRRDALQPVIEATYDLDFVARSIMRKYWKTLEDAQRRRFTDVFRQLCVGTYADRFDRYSDQRFETLDERKLKRGSILVRTRLLRPGKKTVQLEYVLVERDGGWRIVNVVADGVSDLALKRAEYASVMEKEGFDGLLGRLQDKIDAFAPALAAAQPDP